MFGCTCGFAHPLGCYAGSFAHSSAASDQGVLAGVSTHMPMGAPFSRPVDSTSHAMVLVSTAAQGPVPRSVVLHDTRYDLPQPERLSVPSLQVTFARGSSPPRVEEVCEVMEAREQKQFDCSFDPATSADARRSLPSVALAGGPAAFRLPTAPETALPLSEGFTSAGIAGGLPGGLRGGPHAGTFFVNPSANHSAPMLLLEMRHDAPGKEVSAPPVQTHAQIQEAQEPACHNDPNDSDEIGSPLKGIYEVETVLNVRETVNGKREFLIKWKGWGPSWNNWEPGCPVAAGRAGFGYVGYEGRACGGGEAAPP